MTLLWGTEVAGHTKYASWSSLDEEAVDGVHTPPHTLGRAWDLLRIYDAQGNAPSLPVKGLSYHNSGHTLVLSVQKLYYAQSCLAGTTTNSVNVASEAKFDSYFDALLGFGGNAVSYGSGKPTLLYLILQHEPDQQGVGTNAQWGTNTAYIAYWQRVHDRYLAALTRHSITRGTAGDRVKFMFCVTGYSMRLYSATQKNTTGTGFYPGDDYVDIVGSDPYNTSGWAITGGGGAFDATKWKPPSALFGPTILFAEDRGKDCIFGEFDCVEWNYDPAATDHTPWIPAKSVDWFQTQLVAYAAAHPRFKGLCFFVGGELAAGTNYRYDWGMFPLKHEAVRQAILATTGSPPAQGLPANPTGLALVSASDGLSATLTWAVNPTGDNITGWKLFTSTAAGTGNWGTAVATLSATPRSRTISGLAAGSYLRATLVAVNSAGSSGYATQADVTTIVPSGAAPSIDSYLAVPEIGTDTPGRVDVTVAFTDPAVTSCTVNYTPDTGVTPVIFGPFASSPAIFTYDYPASGTVQTSVTVTNSAGSPATSPAATLPLIIDLGDAYTLNAHWTRIRAGIRLDRMRIAVARFQDEADATVGSLLNPPANLSAHNRILGLAGSNFDPVGANQTNQPGVGTLQWHRVQVQSVDGSFSGIVLVTSAAQVGTGSAAAVYTEDGQTKLADATGVDALLVSIVTEPIILPCPAQVTSGDVVTVAIYIPPTGVTTSPIFRGASSTAALYSVGLAASGYRAGFISGASGGCPASLTFGAASPASTIWVGLAP